MSGWRAELNRPNVGLVLALAGVETATVCLLYGLADAPRWVTATLAAVAAVESYAGARLMTS